MAEYPGYSIYQKRINKASFDEKSEDCFYG
jgi:hypothetical protein